MIRILWIQCTDFTDSVYGFYGFTLIRIRYRLSPENEGFKRPFQYGIARDVTASNSNEYVVIQLVNSDDNGSYVCYIYDVNSDGATAVNWFDTKKLMKDVKFKKRDKYVTFPKDAILLPNYEVMDVDKSIRTSTSSDVIAFQKVSSCRAHSYFLTR